MNVKHVAPTGAVVYWNAGPTRRELLAERFGQIGLDKFVPPERTDASALRAALKDHCDQRSQRRRGKDKLVQPHKQQSKHGFEVVDVEWGEEFNDYALDFAVKMDEGRVVVTRGDADSDQLPAAFAEHKVTLTGASIGQALVAVLAHLGGTALRPSGGVYWIAEESVETWQAVAEAAQSAASVEDGNSVYMIHTLLDESGIRAVKDAIVGEINEAASKLADEVRSGDLGEQALTRRQIVAASLHCRVTQYESILGETLDTLHRVIRLAEEAAASAIAVVDESAGIFLHEVSHLLLKHHQRAERVVPRDAPPALWKRWNFATDYAINSMLRGEGIPLPGLLDPVKDGFPVGLVAEEYYRLLEQKSPGQGQPRPSEQTSPDESQPQPGNGSGGSCADGQPRPWELPAPSDCDTPGMKPHEADIMAREAVQKILDKQQGDGSGGWKVWAEGILKPRVDPKLALLRLVRHAVEFTSGQGDYSYRRPNRRNPRPDILLGSAVQPTPRVTVIVDTSGSMDQRDLALSLGLIGKVLNTFRIRDGIRVICGDTSAVTSTRVFDPKQVQLAGGGGTDMGTLIRETAKSKPTPQLIVVCTDGITPWCEPVGIPVVACLTQDKRADRVPSWINVVCLG